MSISKRNFEEFENAKNLLDRIILILSSYNFIQFNTTYIIEDLVKIYNKIVHFNNININNIHIFTHIVQKLNNYVSQLESYYDENNLYEPLDNESITKIEDIIFKLDISIKYINDLAESLYNEEPSSYNSIEYYEKQIKDLIIQKENLEISLNIKKAENDLTSNELMEYKKEHNKKYNDLINAQNQIKRLQTELDSKIKQENAITEWNSKIKDTFSELKKYLKPLNNEHLRLSILFYIYSSLIISIFITIFIIEYNYYTDIKNITNKTNMIDHISKIIPIPIAGALLWGFVYQINRTQRQLVVLAKSIHEITYIEGLLLSLNSLSSNINDSAKTTNIVIDKLINNHLNNSSKIKINEESIIEEEKKDAIPYKTIINILNELKNNSKS